MSNRWIVQGAAEPLSTSAERTTPDKWTPSRGPVVRAIRNVACVAAAGLALSTDLDPIVPTAEWQNHAVHRVNPKPKQRPQYDDYLLQIAPPAAQDILPDTSPVPSIRRWPLRGKAQYDLTQETFQETSTLDKWIGPDAEIRRAKLRGRALYDFQQVGLESVTSDKWTGPQAEIRRAKRRGRALYDQDPSLTREAVSLDRFAPNHTTRMLPVRQPVRPWMAYDTDSRPTVPGISFAPSTGRYLRKPVVTRDRFIVDPKALTQGEAITFDKWFSEPRIRRYFKTPPTRSWIASDSQLHAAPVLNHLPDSIEATTVPYRDKWTTEAYLDEWSTWPHLNKRTNEDA